jgi:hypothetical protein
MAKGNPDPSGPRFGAGQPANKGGRPSTKWLRKELLKHKDKYVRRLNAFIDGKDKRLAFDALKLALAYSFGEPEAAPGEAGINKARGTFTLKLVRGEESGEAEDDAGAVLESRTEE